MTSEHTYPPKIRAIAFDMDGLMFNTEDLYDIVGDRLLQRRGHSFDRTLKRRMMGRPGAEAFQIMKDDLQLSDSIDQLAAESKQIFAEILPHRIQMMPGLIELLTTIEALEIPKCVATSSHRAFAIEALNSFDLESRFEFILTADDVTAGKPAPDIYLAAASQLNVPANQMLALEDSVIGSTAASRAGAITVAVPTQHSIGGDYSHVHRIVDSLQDPYIYDLIRRGRS